VVVFLRSLERSAVARDDALLALALKSATGYAAFVVLLIPGLVFARPSGPVMLGAGLLCAVLLLAVLFLAVLLRDGELHPVVARSVPTRATRFVARARAHRIRPSDLVKPFLLGLAINLTAASMLFVALRAVGQSVSPTQALAAYAVGNLFALVAPVFQGIGLVEASMVVTLQQLGVPAPAAVGATLLFRAADVWLPLTLGLLTQLLTVSAVRRLVWVPASSVSTMAGMLAMIAIAGSGILHGAPITLKAVWLIALGFSCIVVAAGLVRAWAVVRVGSVGIAASGSALVATSVNLIVTLSVLADVLLSGRF
jgi:hypothetical protein